MFIPFWLLIPMAILAAGSAIILAGCFHFAMRDLGLCFLGRRDLYMDNHLLIERWCIFYIPVHSRRGCHSLSTVFE